MKYEKQYINSFPKGAGAEANKDVEKIASKFIFLAIS